MKRLLILCAVAALSVVLASQVEATIVIPTKVTKTLGGLTTKDGNLADYDLITDTATLLLSEGLFAKNEDINAIYILNDANAILSTTDAAFLEGVSFENSDRNNPIEYKPMILDLITLLLDEHLFDKKKHIDAVYVRDNANVILLSIPSGAMLGSPIFKNGDFVEYNPTTNIATLFFDEHWFDNNKSIDVAHILGNDNMNLSAMNGVCLGGLSFGNCSLIKYNLTTDTITSYFQESFFANSVNINPVYVTTNNFAVPRYIPEPTTICLLGLGGLALLRKRSGAMMFHRIHLICDRKE